jgi:hypothetical protein
LDQVQRGRLNDAIDELIDAFEGAKVQPPSDTPLKELVESKAAQLARLDQAVYDLAQFRST